MAEHKIHALGDTVYFHFGSNDTSGSGDDGAGAVYDVRLCGAAAGVIPVDSGGATRLTHANYPDGAHEVAVAATVGNGFAVDSEYAVFCTLLVDGENPTGHVGSFKLVAEGSPAENTVEIAKAVWDRVLNAALHNIAGSAGRRLRQLDPDLFPVWYVDGVGGNDANDGDTPDAPFLTIGAALGVVGVGETIMVGAATYAEAGLDLDVASITLDCTPGTIITGGGGGTCLVITAASCTVLGGLFLPGAAQIGIDVQAGGTYATLVNCMASGCSVGFDVNASWIRVTECTSIGHSVSGFDVSGANGDYDHCESHGAAAVRGYYLSVNTADENSLDFCHSLGNTTRGFEVVAGADNNCFAYCASGGGDGARLDNGTDNSWAGYSTLPALIQADILNDGNPFAGANINATIGSRAAPAQVATALMDIGLDHLLHLAHPTGIPTADTLFDLIMSKDAGQNFARANESLEGLRDRGDAAWPTAAGFAVPGDAMTLTAAALNAIWSAIGATFGTVLAWPVPTTQDFATDLVEASDNHYQFGSIIFISGALTGEPARPILNYVGASKEIQLSLGFTEAPGAGDAFVILPHFLPRVTVTGYPIADLATDAVDALAVASSGANEIRDAILDDATRFSGADIDTNIGSRSTLTAAQVWAHGVRTLTSFGTLVADTATAVWGYVTRTLTAGGDATEVKQDQILDRIGAFTGTGVNSILGFFRAIFRKDVAAPSDMGGTATPADDSQEAIRDRGDAAWPTGGAGTGSSVVTLTYDDGAGTAVSDLKITCRDSAGAALIATATTESDGTVVFNLDDDTYHFLSPSTVLYEQSDNTLVVSGDTAQTYSLTAKSIPAPSSANVWVLFIYGRDEEGVGVSAAERTVRVIDLKPVTDTTKKYIIESKKNPFISNADGTISWEVPKTVEEMTIIETRTMADDSEEEETYSFTIDPTKAVAGRIAVADLLPEGT